MGIQWLDVVRGTQNSIDQVCDLLDDGFAEVGRYAIQTAGHHSYTINGQVLTSAALKRHQTQVCPLCISEDIEQSGKNAAYGRAEWQLTPFKVCPHHSTLMFQLPRSYRPRSPHDFAGRVAEHYPAIINAAGAASVVARESHFETYLSERLLGQSRNIWIDQLDLHVVCKLVQSLGVLLEFGSAATPSKLSDDEFSKAAEHGFQSLGSTKEHFLGLLDKTIEQSRRPVRGFYQDLGVLSRWLSGVDQADPCYAPILDSVSDFAIGRYPIAAGRSVLGRECAERKVHNLSSASVAYGVDIGRLRRFVTRLKTPEDPYDLEVSFPSNWRKHEIAEFSSCLSASAAAALLGLSYDAFRRLAGTGMVSPRFNLPGLSPCYHPDDIHALVASLLKCSTNRKDVPSNFNTLTELCIKTHCPIEELLELALSGSISSLCHTTCGHGLKCLFANPEEIWDRLPVEPANGFSKAELRTLLRVNDSTVRYLVDRGFLDSKTIHRSHKKRAIGLVSGQSLKEFLKEYVTLGILASDENIQVQHVLANLRKRELEPLPFSEHLSKIFLRADLSRVEYCIRKPTEHFAEMITRLHSELRNPNPSYQAARPTRVEVV
jgi:hypothetical protein